MKSFYIHTFGCQMNLHDSEKAAGVLLREGLLPAKDRKEADLIVFNTCSIRQKAEQKFFSELGRLKKLKRDSPGLKIAVMGCIAQQMGEELVKRAPHVDFVIGPQNILSLSNAAAKVTASKGVAQSAKRAGGAGGGGQVAKAPHAGQARRYVSPVISLADNPRLAMDELPVHREHTNRAWVSIMFGCDNFCSYCIVPYTRGREKSRDPQSIINEVRGLAQKGVAEVTLLGQNVNSYTAENISKEQGEQGGQGGQGGTIENTGFHALLARLNEIDGLKRIRFVTSHPRDFSDSLIQAISDLDKVCNHVHLPLQSGSTRVLGLMNRGYSYDDYRRKVLDLKSAVPGVAVTSDIIAGFPGETQADHKLTIEALREIGFDGIFAFKYSPRPGTPASKFPDSTDEDTKSQRLYEILALQDEITLTKNKALEGTLAEVLVEGPSHTDPTMLTSRTPTNKIVNFPLVLASNGQAFPEKSSICLVRITRAGKHSLCGELATPSEPPRFNDSSGNDSSGLKAIRSL